MTEDIDPFVRREGAHDLGVYPRNRSEFAGPIRFVYRPCEPGGRMLFPLGRHAPSGRGKRRQERIGAERSLLVLGHDAGKTGSED